MKLLSCLRVEIQRIFKSRITWLFIILALACPAVGLSDFAAGISYSYLQTLTTKIIGNPVIFGIRTMPVLFFLLTLYEMNRADRYNSSLLTDAVMPRMILDTARLGAVLAVSFITGILTVLAYLPYTLVKMGALFDFKLYFAAYLVYLLPSMWIGSLFAACFYQTFRRVDLAVVLFAACVLLCSSSSLTNQFILRWFNPNMPGFSDGFGNAKILHMGWYNRFFWLLFLGGAWFCSLLFTRKYEKGIFGSLRCNSKKFYLPVCAAVLISASVCHYNNQPFYNDAPSETDWDALYDMGDNLPVLSAEARVTPDFSKGTMYGTVTYNVISLNRTATKKLKLNSGYTVYGIRINGDPADFSEGPDNYSSKEVKFQIPQGKKLTIEVEYGGYPMMWGAYRNILGVDEIDREYVELDSNSLLPSIGMRAPIKIYLDLPEALTPLMQSASAMVREVSTNENGTKTWLITSNMENVSLFAADYECMDIQAGEIGIEFYYSRKFGRLMEENHTDEVIADVFQFCTDHFGSVKNLLNRKIRLVQRSAFLPGGYAVPGMSTASETAFLPNVLQDDSRKGASAREILAHEIIHQWWGLDRQIEEDEETPEWSSEGLTVYSTYRLYKEKYGEEYAKKYYVDQWNRAVEETERDFYHRHPEYLEIMPEQFAANLRAAEEETAKYSLMPLLIYKAEQLVGGEEAMDDILRNLTAGRTDGLTMNEFLDACGLTREELSID